jgi:hypothetical protein
MVINGYLGKTQFGTVTSNMHRHIRRETILTQTAPYIYEMTVDRIAFTTLCLIHKNK